MKTWRLILPSEKLWFQSFRACRVRGVDGGSLFSSQTNPQRILFPVQEPAGRLRAVKDLPFRRMKNNNNNLLNIHKRRKTLFAYYNIYIYICTSLLLFCYWPVVGDMSVHDWRHEYFFIHFFFCIVPNTVQKKTRVLIQTKGYDGEYFARGQLSIQ